MQRVDGGLVQVSCGPPAVARLFEVHRQFGGDLAGAVAVHGLAALTDPPVRVHAPRPQHALVEHLLVDGVHEGEPARGVPVGEQRCAAALDELLPPAQVIAAHLDVGRRLVQCRGHRGDGEVRAGDAGGLHELLIARLEAIELGLDQLPDGVGNPDLDGVEGRRQLPAVLVRRDQPLGDQVVDRVHHEERVAAGALVDERAERRRKTVGGKTLGEVLRHEPLGEVFERQLLALLPGDELLLDRLERVAAHDQFRGPIGPDQHQVSGAAAAGDVGDQVERREVAPVQVFQHEHQRRPRGQRIQGLAHLAEHALARRAAGVAGEALAIGRRHQRRQLHQPHRRVQPQDLDRRGVVPAQLPDRVEDRQIRFAHPVLGQALPAAEPAVRLAGHRARERLQQRRLADAGLSRHEHHLALAAARPVEPAPQV